MSNFTLILTLIVMLSGCSNVANYRDNLVEVTSPSHFLLDKHLEYKIVLDNAFGDEVERTVKLKKGLYTAFSENKNGTFYTTEEDYNFLNIIKIKGEISSHHASGFHTGGIWITKEQKNKAIPYYIFGKSKPYQIGLDFFDNSKDNVDLSEITAVLPSRTSLEYVPGMSLDEPVLDGAVTHAVVLAIIATAVGKPILEMEIPQDVFESNIKVIHEVK